MTISRLQVTRWLIIVAMMWMPPAPACSDEFNVTPSIAVRGEYNDNVFFSVNDAEDDTITTVTAGLKMSDRTEILDWMLKAEASPFFYADHDDLGDVDQDYQGRIGYQATQRLSLNADAGFRVDNRPDRDIEETGLVADSEKRFSINGNVGMGYALSEIHRVSVSYAYGENDWHDDDSGHIDYQGHSVTLGTTYAIDRWLRESSLGISVGYNQYDYDAADIKSGYGSVGLTSMLNEIFQIQVVGGVRYTETQYEALTPVLVPPGVLVLQQKEEKTDGWGGVGSLGLDYLGERTRCRLSLSHDLRPASGTRGPSNLTRAVFNMNHKLHRRLTVGLYSSYFINSADADEFYAQSIDEENFNIRPRVRWEFLDHFTLEAAYTYRHLTDNKGDTRTERQVVSLQLAFGYPLWD
ncbi:MAG: hypothetical protein CR984_01350 [Proteobacteria bacterium]|nr:MAG: hypothetical protein CR984_01350 [Pseudomonadota bacterium]PIE67461.1 MAG: hypothetical protein CSA23_04235 [Deltaproteobacteria bacterium]